MLQHALRRENAVLCKGVTGPKFSIQAVRADCIIIGERISVRTSQRGQTAGKRGKQTQCCYTTMMYW